MKRLFSLFVAVFFLVYILPFPLDIFSLSGWYSTFLDFVTIKFGKAVLHIHDLQRVEETGSGDGILYYVATFVNVIFATIVSLLLLVFFRRKIDSQKIFRIVGVYARCYLSYHLISYGFAKVLIQQFPDLNYFRLAEPYGESTPMGLFWTLMSGSKSYTMFSGWLEVVAGYLIFFKRTKTMGGVLAIILMVQIVMINLCYDVCVKLFSIHLLCMSFFVLGDDIDKMCRFFILRQPTQLSEGTGFKNKRWLYGSFAIQCVILLVMTYLNVDLSADKKLPVSVEQFRGVYQRREFNFDKAGSSGNAEPGWQEMIIDKRYDGTLAAKVIMPDRTRFRYTVHVDTIAKKIEFVGRDSTDLGIQCEYKKTNDTFYFNGLWAGKIFKSVFIKRDKSSFNLTNTGFHWIQEQPNNQ